MLPICQGRDVIAQVGVCARGLGAASACAGWVGLDKRRAYRPRAGVVGFTGRAGTPASALKLKRRRPALQTNPQAQSGTGKSSLIAMVICQRVDIKLRE